MYYDKTNTRKSFYPQFVSQWRTLVKLECAIRLRNFKDEIKSTIQATGKKSFQDFKKN